MPANIAVSINNAGTKLVKFIIQRIIGERQMSCCVATADASAAFYGRESSQIQLTSQVLPPSGENDCSIRDDCGEMLSQT